MIEKLSGEPLEYYKVEDLMAFVIAERGRTADLRLEKSLPVCLYFPSEKDRDEFITLVHEIKPNWISKKLP